jgi:hypothetical protein
MTAVEQPTTPTPLTRGDADKLDGQIRRAAARTGSHLDELAALVAKAKAGRIHTVLDFPSWTAYLANALAPLCSGQGREARREIVRLLADEGMSLRGIAAATGTPKSTVADDLQQVSENRTPVAVTTGLDGKQYQGKSRGGLTSQKRLSWRTETRQLEKTTERIERLAADQTPFGTKDACRLETSSDKLIEVLNNLREQELNNLREQEQDQTPES